MVSKKKTHPKTLTFQETIMNLQKFWSKEGCAILQPYDMESEQEHFILQQL